MVDGAFPVHVSPPPPPQLTSRPCTHPGCMQRWAAMKLTDFQHDTSAARMATGMTSRARRPEPHIFAG